MGIAAFVIAAAATAGPHPEAEAHGLGFIEILTVAALLLANAFFVAAEFALVKVRTSQVEELVQRGSWAARITSRILDHLDAYISASQVGITLASLGLGFVIESSIEPSIETALAWVGLPEVELPVGAGMTVAAVLAFLVATFLHISLGELVPKSLAIRSARPVALATAPPLMGFYYLFFPIIWTLNAFSDLILRAMGSGALDNAAVAHTEEELKHILAESVQGGHLTRSERVMIENVLELEEKNAKRVMVPRPDIAYLSLAWPLEKNLSVARRAGHTRYPLCREDLSSVIGMVHVKDLFREGGEDGDPRPDLESRRREVLYLPESLRLDHLLLEFQRKKVHMAMLLDEYGSVVGLVTLENVLEELVGPIQDEFDREDPRIVPLADGAFEVDASIPVDMLAEQCGVEVPEGVDSDTTGGLILEVLGRLARVGDQVPVGRHLLTVRVADPTRIRRVRIEPVEPPEPEAPEPPGPERDGEPVDDHAADPE